MTFVAINKKLQTEFYSDSQLFCLLQGDPKIHSRLGPGLLESVYEEIVAYELRKLNLFVERQKDLPVVWDELRLEKGYRADLILERKLLMEFKSVEQILPVHQKQTLTYIRLQDIKLALLVNFNVAYIKNGIQRIVNGL